MPRYYFDVAGHRDDAGLDLADVDATEDEVRHICALRLTDRGANRLAAITDVEVRRGDAVVLHGRMAVQMDRPDPQSSGSRTPR